MLIQKKIMQKEALKYDTLQIDGHTVIIDPCRWRELIELHWKIIYKNNTPYAIRKQTINSKSVSISMHRQIVNAPDGYEVHHINRNSLDNRFENLLICNRQQHIFLHHDLPSE